MVISLDPEKSVCRFRYETIDKTSCSKVTICVVVQLIDFTRSTHDMNATPNAIMLRDPTQAAPGAKSGARNPTTPPEDSFSRCMPWISDYDEEWTSFIEQHSMHECWASKNDSETEVLPRVWNLPHS